MKLEDGRTLVVQYQGARYGWGAYIPGDSKPPTDGATPAEAIVTHLELAEDDMPQWVRELSEDYEREFRESLRFICQCCGYRTLLSEGHYEICDVCGWEDDRCDFGRRDGDLDIKSGPNRISLREARANFRRLGRAMNAQGSGFAIRALKRRRRNRTVRLCARDDL